VVRPPPPRIADRLSCADFDCCGANGSLLQDDRKRGTERDGRTLPGLHKFGKRTGGLAVGYARGTRRPPAGLDFSGQYSEAIVLKSLLDAQGIDASLHTDFMAVSFTAPTTRGSPALYVRRRDAERARVLVDEFLRNG
jgi:hypothetical protein